MAMRRRKVKGPKRVSYELIDPKHETVGKPMYAMLRDIVRAHLHDELGAARIALAWNTSWRPDVDGYRVVAKLRRASELDRELAPYDFVLMILKPVWQDAFTSDVERRRLLHRELCRGRRRLDDRTLEPVVDAKGRTVYRIRKAPIQEFPEIIQIYGFDPKNADLQAVAREAIQRAKTEIWVPCEACRESTAGAGRLVVVQNGVERVTRCQCWSEFQSRRAEAMAS